MTKRELAIQWMANNTKVPTEYPNLWAQFEQELDTAMQLPETKLARWDIGHSLHIKNEPCELLWHEGTFKTRFSGPNIDAISGKVNISMRMFVYDLTKPIHANFKEIIEAEVMADKAEINKNKLHPDGDPKVMDYIHKAWACYSIVDTVNKLYEPTSRKQLDDSKVLLQKARDVNPGDEHSQYFIDELQRWIDKWEKRQFDGRGTEKGIVYVMLAMWAFAIVRYVMMWDKFSENLANSGLSTGRLILGGVIGVVLFVTPIVYLWALRAPLWLVDKRNRKPRRRIYNFINRSAKKQMNADYQYQTTDQYGNKKSESDAALSMMGPMLGIMVKIMYYGGFTALLPLYVLVAILRNYVLYK